MNLRDQILNSQDYQTKEIEVPEWDCTLTIRGLSAKGFMAFQQASMKAQEDDMLSGLATALIFGVIDEEGRCVFTKKDMNKLMEKSTSVILRVGAEVITLSGFDETEEDIEKN